MSSGAMLRQALPRFLQLGSRSLESLFAAESKSGLGGKKGALKSNGAPKKVRRWRW